MNHKFEEFQGSAVPDCQLLSGRSGSGFQFSLEGASFAEGEPPPKKDVVVMAYNIQRGIRWKEQVTTLTSDPEIPQPDVILLSEVDRGCTRSGSANVAREYAQALGMNYVFGVEFIELPRLFGPNGRVTRACEHGNAILSRFPIGEIRQLRHRRNRDWYSWWQHMLRVGEPRRGGRMALSASVNLGTDLLTVYAVHFESKGGDTYRPAQAIEVAEDGIGKGGVVIGGDTNFESHADDLRHGRSTDEGVRAIMTRGYSDAHARLPWDHRVTSRSDSILDFIFVREAAVLESGVGKASRWGDLSDHLPVWARIGVKP